MAKWIIDEAKKLLEQIEKSGSSTKEIVFETGFGASGLPHIGTFAEVARTTMVCRAFSDLRPDLKTRLICFSDDMDALRKVPENLPNQEMLKQNLEMPLSKTPDPFGEKESFAAYNNAKLCGFLDRFGFDYEFASATDYYKSGKFDEAIKKIIANYDQVKEMVARTLGEERQKTYSPFLPICPETGKVLMVKIIAVDKTANSISYKNDEGKTIEVSILGGACKLQWKVDWAMRWIALKVDYEMSGKDLAESVKLSSKICRALKTEPPIGLIYELFLDENGEKISKSRGNGLTIDEWLRYAPVESLSRFLMRPPKSAKRLHFDVIPANADDYIKDVNAWFDTKEEKEKEESPIKFIQNQKLEKLPASISFSLLLNLVSASGAETNEMLWGFVSNLAPETNPKEYPFLDGLIGCAINYFNDFIKPHKEYRTPNNEEKQALEDLLDELKKLPSNPAAQEIQQLAYDIGTKHQLKLRDWFQALYEILLGQKQGARFGSFAALYGIKPTMELIEKALKK